MDAVLTHDRRSVFYGTLYINTLYFTLVTSRSQLN